jgi:ankyrin repeat protein
MKHILITTIAAVVLVGCGPSVDIWEAARTGNIEAVKQHLAAGTDVNAKNERRRTPLHTAARNDQKEVAELLIAKGADVNAKDDFGVTPLHAAASEGQNEIAEPLIAKGADVNAQLDDSAGERRTGDTPLDNAIVKKHTETADLLRKHGGKTGEELKAEGK